ncbi:MAG: MFS transporter [Spirochaetaceae bacterium]
MEPYRNGAVQTIPTRTGWSVVAIAAVHGLVHAFSIFLSPLNDEIRRYFLADAVATVTAFKSTYLATYAVSNLVFGLLTNRISARRTLALGLGLNGAAVAAFALVSPSGVLWMHGLWLMAAVGGGVYHPVANVLITRLYPRQKGRVIGLTGMGAAVGFALGPLFTTALSSWAGLGWQSVALIFGCFGIAAAAWVYVVVRDAPEGSFSVEEAEAAGAPADAAAAPTDVAAAAPLSSTRPRFGGSRDAGPGSPAFGGVAGLASIGGVLAAIIVISGVREMAMWSVLDISDFFLLRLFDGPGRTGLFLFLLYAPGIVIQPLAGGLSDALGRRWLATGSFALYGASVAVAAILPAPLVFLAYLGMGIGQAATIPIIEAYVADVAGPELRGAAYGLFFTTGIALGALGPGGTGLLVDTLGGGLDAFRLVFGALGILVFVAAGFIPLVIGPGRHGGGV